MSLNASSFTQYPAERIILNQITFLNETRGQDDEYPSRREELWEAIRCIISVRRWDFLLQFNITIEEIEGGFCSLPLFLSVAPNDRMSFYRQVVDHWKGELTCGDKRDFVRCTLNYIRKEVGFVDLVDLKRLESRAITPIFMMSLIERTVKVIAGLDRKRKYVLPNLLLPNVELDVVIIFGMNLSICDVLYQFGWRIGTMVNCKGRDAFIIKPPKGEPFTHYCIEDENDSSKTAYNHFFARQFGRR